MYFIYQRLKDEKYFFLLKSQKPDVRFAARGQCLVIISVLALMKKNSWGWKESPRYDSFPLLPPLHPTPFTSCFFFIFFPPLLCITQLFLYFFSLSFFSLNLIEDCVRYKPWLVDWEEQTVLPNFLFLTAGNWLKEGEQTYKV